MSMLNYHGHTFGRSHTLEVHKPQVALMCVSFDFYHVKNYWEMLSKIIHSYIQQIFTEYTQTSQAQYQMLETVQWEKMWLLFLRGLRSRKGDISKKQLERVWEMLWGLPGGIGVKNLPANAGDERDVGLIPWVRKVTWSGKWQHAPAFLPGKFHGQRSLVGYSPRDHKEWDTT